MIKPRLAHVLFDEKMSCKELAKRIGVSESVIYRAKKCDLMNLDLETLDKICSELNCQPGDLLIYKEDE